MQIMEAETFPDVTLSDPGGCRATKTFTSRSSNSSNVKDTYVVLNRSRPPAVILSRCQGMLAGLLALVFLLAAVVATVFITIRISKNSDVPSCPTLSSIPPQITPTSSSSAAFSSLYSVIQNDTSLNHKAFAQCVKTNCSKLPLTTAISQLGGGPASGETGPSPTMAKTTETKTTTHEQDQHPFSDESTGFRLPDSVKPSLYAIHIRINIAERKFHGSVNITARITSATRYVVFHRNGLEIDESSVTIVSKSSPSRHVIRHFQVPKKHFHVLELDGELDAGASYTVVIGSYDAKLYFNMRGLYLSSYHTTEGEYRELVASQLQAMDARRMMPCMDEPAMKARFKLSIEYRKGYTTLSNMPPITTTDVDEGWVRTDFETTPFMSTYLLAVVVSDFKSRNYTFDDGYKMRMWARQDAYSQTEHALGFGIKTYKFFSEYFGMKDVVPKSDHVAVPDFGSGAMENWGLVIYRETAMLYDQLVSSAQNKFMVTLVVAHEISHTWFGNMVTMDWWDDLWLNEGFASLLMYLAMDHVYPEWNVFGLQVVADTYPAMGLDALTTSHPVSAKISTAEDIEQNFDSISYCKGMMVLRMMLDFTGAEKFRHALSVYVKTFKFKNADMAQLWQTFTKATNATYNVSAIMDTWTRQMGYPVVHVYEKPGYFRLEQSRFLLDVGHGKITPSPYDYKWYIPFTYITQDNTSQRLVWMNLDSAIIPKKSTHGWLLGNIEVKGFYRVQYEPAMWGRLAQQLMDNHLVIPESNRAGLIGDALNLARANMLSYDVALNMTRYLKNEHGYIPWKSFLQSIEFLQRMISNKAAYVGLQQYLKTLVAPVFAFYRASDNGELPERYSRGLIMQLACDVGLEKAVTYAKSMFDNWMTHGNRLPPDLALVIYSVGVREGDVQEWNYVWNKTRETVVSSERDMLMESLVYTQKTWLLYRYIEYVFNPKFVKMQDVRVAIQYFTKTPQSRMVALDYITDNWKHIVKLFEGQTFVLREIVASIAEYVNKESKYIQLATLFEANKPTVASKSVANALAHVRANIGWMEKNYDEIADWLSIVHH